MKTVVTVKLAPMGRFVAALASYALKKWVKVEGKGKATVFVKKVEKKRQIIFQVIIDPHELKCVSDTGKVDFKDLMHELGMSKTYDLLTDDAPIVEIIGAETHSISGLPIPG